MASSLRGANGRSAPAPPAAPESERAILGSVLLRPDLLSEVSTWLGPEVFSLSRHGEIFAALVEMARRGEPIDPLALCEHLALRLDVAGGAAYISDLSTGVVADRDRVLHHAEHIREAAIQRDVVRLANEIEKGARHTKGPDLEALLRGAEQRLASLRQRAAGSAHSWNGNLGELLSATRDFLRRFLVLTEAQCAVLAAWIAHTHALTFDAWACTPYLAISSAEKQSGKTRLLEVLELLVEKPWFTGRVSPAALARKIEAERPTLLLDESDAAFNGAEEYAETLRGVLNTGHRRSGSYSVCVGKGAKMEVRDFSTFCAKAIAGLGRLPDTVADRSIPIRLRRRLQSEKVERFQRRDEEPVAKGIRERLAGWASANHQLFHAARPELPDELSDRQREAVEPLLAIADLAGGLWPAVVRNALLELFGGPAAADESLGVRLLADVRDVFDELGADKLCSQDLVEHLGRIEGAPWAEFSKGRPLTVNTLARLLRRYEIGPRNIRTECGVAKGYPQTDFEDAWSRYLAGDRAPEPLHPLQDAVPEVGSAISGQLPIEGVAVENNGDSPLFMESVAAVAAQDVDVLEEGYL